MSESDNILNYTMPTKEVLEPLTAQVVVKRFFMWGAMVGCCAIPSFVWAHRSFDMLAMVAGVLFFVAVYTICSCTPAFRRFYRLPHVRTTMYIGYITRLALSIAFPLGMFLDLFPGMLSVDIVRSLVIESNFMGTLLVTILQGVFLNVIVFLYMGVVYLVIFSVSRVKREGS
jgi:hypothetical protein